MSQLQPRCAPARCPVPESPGLTLITGATGYVGGRLREALEAESAPLRCLARRPEFLTSRVAESTEVVKGDVLDRDSLLEAMSGVTTAYYLVHSMSDEGDWEEMERRAARTFEALGALRELGQCWETIGRLAGG